MSGSRELSAAGAAHSACLDESGAVLAWRSADPGLHVQEVGGPLAGKRVVSISAGVLPLCFLSYFMHTEAESKSDEASAYMPGACLSA